MREGRGHLSAVVETVSFAHMVDCCKANQLISLNICAFIVEVSLRANIGSSGLQSSGLQVPSH